jgi:hypothetical protein
VTGIAGRGRCALRALSAQLFVQVRTSSSLGVELSEPFTPTYGRFHTWLDNAMGCSTMSALANTLLQAAMVLSLAPDSAIVLAWLQLNYSELFCLLRSSEKASSAGFEFMVWTACAHCAMLRRMKVAAPVADQCMARPLAGG